MKRLEMLAWSALAGLIAIAGILLCGGLLYQFTAFWAGMMLALGQALVVGLAAWGFMLSRQAAELGDGGPMISGTRVDQGPAVTAGSGGTSGFCMSMSGDETNLRPDLDSGQAKTLDSGFQRLLVGISAIVLIGLAITTGYLAYRTIHWARLNPDQAVPIAGLLPTAGKPLTQWPVDELALVIGLGAAGIYGVLYWITRPKKQTTLSGEALHGVFLLGVSGMAALGIATILGYARFAYASEIASGVIAALMALQGFELAGNALRSYSGIEELDQEAVDLQALPLVPMLGSVWLSGLKILFAQSVGLSGEKKGEKGVIARMMPRALAAVIVIAVAMSCLRVVEPGTVAVRERLGYAPYDEQTQLLKPDAVLKAGLHITLPWPMDQLVVIPTERLQTTRIGAELHAPKNWKNVDFQFWTLRGDAREDESFNEFVTGDARAPQILETYVEVRWRVEDPEKFYSMLSHSEFYEKESNETKTLPIFQAIVQDCASFAVTRTFAIHSLDQIMITDRGEVERHCMQILQDKLDSMKNGNGLLRGSGIQVQSLIIKDLHPPWWRNDLANPSEPPIGPGPNNTVSRGPASAFEFVVSMREWKETQINQAEAYKISVVNQAKGDYDSDIARAKAYQVNRIAEAQGLADRYLNMTHDIPPKEKSFQLGLLRQQNLYSVLKDLLDPVSKVIVDPKAGDVQVYQTSDNGASRPPGT